MLIGCVPGSHPAPPVKPKLAGLPCGDAEAKPGLSPSCQPPCVHPQFADTRFGGNHVCHAVQPFPFRLDARNGGCWCDVADAAGPTPEQEQACTNDAFRLCGPDIPDVDRVTACMVRNQSQLSPGCRVYFKPEPAVTPVAAGRPLSIGPASSRKPVSATPKKPKKKPAAT